MGRFFLKVLEDVPRAHTELPQECFGHERVGERRHRGLGLGELSCVGYRKEIFVDAEHLGQLERPPLQPAEGLVDCFRITLVENPAEIPFPLGSVTADHGAAVMLEVIDADTNSRASERRHPADCPGRDCILRCPG